MKTADFGAGAKTELGQTRLFGGIELDAGEEAQEPVSRSVRRRSVFAGVLFIICGLSECE